MKRLTHLCIRHGWLPTHPWLRRLMLRSIFKPITVRDYGSGIDGWYDLGLDASPEDAKRFKAWLENR